MKQLYIYCEGQTEEAFINDILAEYLLGFGILAIPIIHQTKRTASKKYKGGVSSYDKVKKELKMLCYQHHNETVTTMFDYYGMPFDTPGIDCMEIDLYKRMEIIERSVEEDIGQPNLKFNLLLHEFEALLFSAPQAFSSVTSNDKSIAELQNARDDFLSPEHINNSPNTAPSKRILKILPDYSKVSNGITVSKTIGIDTMLKECKHFSTWLDKIKKI